MTGKVSEVRTDDDRYGYKALSDVTKKRLDLNDLLKRVKSQEKKDKKINFTIYIGVIAVIAVFILFISS